MSANSSNPFAAALQGMRREDRRREKLAARLVRFVPNFVSACQTVDAETPHQDRWARAVPILADCAELAAEQAADPQAARVDEAADALERRLMAFAQPEPEFRELLAVIIEEAHPALVPFCAPLFDVLDNGSRLRLALDPANLSDGECFVAAARQLATAFHHGDGKLARHSMRTMCSFIRNGWL